MLVAQDVAVELSMARARASESTRAAALLSSAMAAAWELL